MINLCCLEITPFNKYITINKFLLYRLRVTRSVETLLPKVKGTKDFRFQTYFNSTNSQKNYRKCIVLLQVFHDILQSTEEGLVTALVLLDYSKTFDRIYYNILITILSIYWGV